MADINTLLGLGITDEAQMQALANQLRGQQQQGQFLGLSTLQPVSQMGQGMSRDASRAAERGGVLRQAKQREQTRQQELAEQQAIDAQMAQQKQSNFERTKAAEQQRYDEQQAQLQAERDREAQQRDLKTFHHPSGDGVLNLERKEDGNYYDQTGQVYDPTVVARLTPYSAGVEGSKAKALALAREEEFEEDLLASDVTSSVIASPLLAGATGPVYDPIRQLAKHTDAFPEVQSLQNKMAQVSLEGAGPMLSQLGVNPTDKDMAVAFETVPTQSSEPQVWVDWYSDRFAPRLLKAVKRQNPAVYDKLKTELDKNIAQGRANIKKNKAKPYMTAPQTEKASAPEAERSLDDLLKLYGG